jgi:hypothetical protein
LMQVSGNFRVPADRSWLVLVGAVVGDFLASDNSRWLAIVTRAAASSREAMPDRSVGNRPASWVTVVAAVVVSPAHLGASLRRPGPRAPTPTPMAAVAADLWHSIVS